MVDKRFILIGLLTLIFIAGCSTSEEGADYTIEGNSVYVNDSNIYLRATPHTIAYSDWVEVEFESKLFGGEVDFAFGFNTDTIRPTAVERWNPHEEEISYTCDHEFTYTTNPNYFKCYYTQPANATSSDINITVFEHDFLGGNLQEQTAWWNISKNWTNFAGAFDSVDFDFDGKNKWWYIKGQNINAGQEYKIRYFLDVPANADAKYDIGIKPSSETMQEAIENEHLYFLDPFVHATLNNGLFAYYTFDNADLVGNTVTDVTGYGRDGTESNTLTGFVGIIEESFNWTLETSKVSVNDDVQLRLGSGGTTNMWMNLSGVKNGGRALSKGDYTAVGEGYECFWDDTGILTCRGGGGTMATSTAGHASITNWTMVTVIWADTVSPSSIYINGTNVTDSGLAKDIGNTAGDIFKIGQRFSADSASSRTPIDEMGIWNRSLTPAEITALYNAGVGLPYTIPAIGNSTTVDTPTILPAVAYAGSGSLNCSTQVNVSSGADFNATLNWSNATYSTATNFTNVGNGTYISVNVTPVTTFVSGEVWNCSVWAYQYDNISVSSTNSSIITISDTVPVWVDAPYNLTIFHTSNVTLDYNCTDVDGAVTYGISNYTGDLTTPLTINTTEGTINSDATYYDIGQFDYNVTCAQAGIFINRTFNLTVNQNIDLSQRALKDPVSEGISETFYLDIGIQNYSGIPSLNPVLQFNGTDYVGSVISSGTVANTNYWNYSTTMSVLNTTGSIAGVKQGFNWTFNLTSVLATDFETDYTNVTVFKVGIDNCSTYNNTILNFTLMDEENVVGIAGDIDIDLTLRSWQDSSIAWRYNDSWTNSTGNRTRALICVPQSLLNESSYMIYITSAYMGEDGVQEFFFLDYGNLSSLPTYNPYTYKISNLFSLNATDSTSFLIRYVNLDGLKVEDVLIHAYRRYIGEGLFREVERGRQNDEGESELHLVEEDVIYYFMVTQNGTILFTSNQFQATCQAVPCTVDLEEAGDFIPFGTDWDLVSDGAFSVTSDGTAREVMLTFTASNVSQWNLTIYKYNNNPADATVVNGSYLTAMAGTVTVSAPISAGNITYVARVQRDDVYLRDSFVSFGNSGLSSLQTAGGVILGALFVIAMVMMASTQGIAVVIFAVLGIVLVGILKLIELNWIAFILLLTMAGIIIWKLTRRTD